MSPVESPKGGRAFLSGFKRLLSIFQKKGFDGAKLYLEVHLNFQTNMGGK
jgi:hypothetical protein